MGNCLVTRLKEAVNNPNLPIFGKVAVLKVNTTGSGKTMYFKNYDNSDIELSCDENGLFPNGQRAITLSGSGTLSTSVSVSTGETIIYIKNVSKLSILSTSVSAGTTENGFEICDSTLIPTLEHLTEFGIRKGYTSIEVFSELTELENLKVTNSGCSGGLSDLVKLTKLTSFAINFTGISGSLETFAASQVASPNNRTSGTLRIYCNGVVTVGGEAVASGTSKYIDYGTSYEGGYQIR